MHSLSHVYKIKCFEMRAPNYLTSKSILLHKDVHAGFRLIFRTFLCFVLGKGPVNNFPHGKPAGSKK